MPANPCEPTLLNPPAKLAATRQPSLIALFKQFPGVRYWPVWGLMVGLRLLSWLPLPVLWLLGAVVGELACQLHRRRRKITLRNLGACFPTHSDAELRALARGHFRSLVMVVLAAGVAWWGSATRLKRLTRFQRREILDDANQRGESIIFLAPHFAGLECGGLCLSTLAPMVSMYRPHKNPLMDALIFQHRSRFGAIQYPSDAAAKSMIGLLRQGRWFYYLPDQDPGRSSHPKESVFAPFYSIPTATYAALGRLARLGNATVIPCATRILPWGRGFEIIFNPPLADYPCGDAALDTAKMNRAIEQLIAHAPQQYFWSHRRFKTRPVGEPPFYD